MKKLLMMVIMLVAAINLYAQDKKQAKTPEEKATNASAKLAKELGLNEEQKSKVYTLALEKNKKVAEIKAKYPNDKKAAQAEIKPVREAFHNDLKALLTAEQATKWEQLKKDKKAKHKGKKAATGDEDDED